MKAPQKVFRCAIYTRVSTDDGLDQEFNSLDAQREASEAYIKSQASEGWTLAAGRYDDGGVVPLGYRVEERKLLIDQEEAETMRLIFQRYLDMHSLPALQRDLRARGTVTRKRVLSTGRVAGGVPLTNGPLGYLLRNRMYLGELNHKGSSYPGEHEAIIAKELFDKVRAQLNENLNGHRRKREHSNALLLGLIFDDRGNRMSPTASQKNRAIRYRYYTSCVMAQGQKDAAGSVSRVPAPVIELIIIDALRGKGCAHVDDRALVRDNVTRIDILADKILVKLVNGDLFSLPWSKPTQARRREIIGNPGSAIVRPMKAEARVVLLRSIAQGRRWLDELVKGRIDSLDAIAAREACSRRHVERTVANAFLSPQIVKAACEGRLPRGANARALADAPAEWSAQLNQIGITAAS